MPHQEAENLAFAAEPIAPYGAAARSRRSSASSD